MLEERLAHIFLHIHALATALIERGALSREELCVAVERQFKRLESK